MNTSALQDTFLRELAESFVATQSRLSKRLTELDSDNATGRDEAIRDELRGLYHGLLVIFDGGTSLADDGLISIVDDDGVCFDRNLHEIGFRYWET